MTMKQSMFERNFRPFSIFIPPNESERVLLSILLRNGVVSQSDLNRMMNLTQPSVSRMISALVDKGMIIVGEKPRIGRGQPSALLSLNPEYAYAIGISIVGDRLGLVLIDFSGKILCHISKPMKTMEQKEVIKQLSFFKKQMIRSAGIDEKRLFAAGVGFSGYFVGEGELMNPPHQLDEWALIDISKALSNALNIPVVVDNDGNVGAIGEALRGAGKKYRNFAYFQISNGFGGGVVIDGKPYRGSFGNAGEFAVIWSNIGIEPPNLNRLRMIMLDKGVEYETFSEMLLNLDISHEGVKIWLNEAIPAFTIAAAAAVATMDCEAIIIGGQIPKYLANKLVKNIKINVGNRRNRPKPLPVIITSEVDNLDPVSLGAAFFAFQSTFFG